MTTLKRVTALGTAAAIATAVTLAGPAHAIDKKEFKVVGTWGNLLNWKDHESRLWTKVLPEASGGKLTANAKPNTELGLSGFEVMRLLKLGAYDAAHAVTSYAAADSPALEGIDLAGVIQDFDQYRKAIKAYTPVIAREVSEKYNSKLLMLYTFPSQQLWCTHKGTGELHLKDLKGKKIRTYSKTLGDFIEGLGASAVTLAFAEVVPALQRGVADCGITGTAPAYNAKWYQVVTHNVRVRLGYAATFMAMNNKVWNSLSKDTQDLIEKNAAKVEDEMWKSVKETDKHGMNCNAKGPCPWGKPGGMTAIEADAADQAQLKSIVKDFVVKRWAKRCGDKCAKEWAATIGKVAGVSID
ncbi:MAG: TRAP-type C4-dicarboxylate transport system substrate-binding protein [Hyphomicrobiaceae bacterium]|jgi:TRAP-type C4-dicarboxylate transport system substrate-binding protein